MPPQLQFRGTSDSQHVPPVCVVLPLVLAVVLEPELVLVRALVEVSVPDQHRQQEVALGRVALQ